jgi:hypothetical protein
MNQNPWYVDGLAAYERERVRSEMKQIRLEEAARKTSDLEQTKSKTRASRPGRLMQIVLITIKWLVSVGR